jgi:hypothetical protein
MHTVTPWSTTAETDIENSDIRDILLERKILNYTYQFYNTGDSLWIIALMPESGKIIVSSSQRLASSKLGAAEEL